MAFWSVETSKRALEYPIGYRVMLVPVVADRRQRPSGLEGELQPLW